MNTTKIADLNDLCRKQLGAGGKALLTPGILEMPLDDTLAILRKVQHFSQFTDDNNPHGERDFGAFTHGPNKIFWKIDYYNRTMDGGSEDPSDPAVTLRVLTIMLAGEY